VILWFYDSSLRSEFILYILCRVKKAFLTTLGYITRRRSEEKKNTNKKETEHRRRKQRHTGRTTNRQPKEKKNRKMAEKKVYVPLDDYQKKKKCIFGQQSQAFHHHHLHLQVTTPGMPFFLTTFCISKLLNSAKVILITFALCTREPAA